MIGCHGLLRLERRAWPQNACSGCTERHLPCLNHALPWIETCCPWSRLVVEASTTAVAATAPAIRSVGRTGGATSVEAIVTAWRVGGGGVVPGARRCRWRNSTGRVTMCDGQCVGGLNGDIVFDAGLLKHEEGASAHEGVRWELGGDHGLDVAVLWIEPAKKVEHLTGFGDGMADVAKLIGETLQLGAVGIHRQVALLQGTQLGFKVHSTLKFVILKQVFDGVPQREGVIAVATDDVEDALGDCGEDPVGNTGIHHTPFTRTVTVWGGRTNMAGEAEFSEHRFKEASPLPIVPLVHVEDDRNVLADGNALDN